MPTDDRFTAISRGIYALFDGDFIDKRNKSSVTETFCDGLAEVMDIALDTEAHIHASTLSPILEKIREGDTSAVSSVQSLILQYLDSDEAKAVMSEYYAQMVPVIMSAIPEEKKTIAQDVLDGIGVTSEMLQGIHDEYLAIIKNKKKKVLSGE